jgi:hypothetical protein
LRIWIDNPKSGKSPAAGLVFTITLEELEVTFIQIVHGMVFVVASYYLNQNFSRRHPQNVPRTGINRDITWHSRGRHLRLHDLTIGKPSSRCTNEEHKETPVTSGGLGFVGNFVTA